nr:MAG TPA: hypothetical protein [Caudoviricetes sp.]
MYTTFPLRLHLYYTIKKKKIQVYLNKKTKNLKKIQEKY